MRLNSTRRRRSARPERRLKAKKRIEASSSEVMQEVPDDLRRQGRGHRPQARGLAYVVSQLQIYSLLAAPSTSRARLRGDRGLEPPRRPGRVLHAAQHLPDDRDHARPRRATAIIDPACGTGGFLITAMNYVLENIAALEISKWDDVERAETEQIRQRVQRFARTTSFGST